MLSDPPQTRRRDHRMLTHREAPVAPAARVCVWSAPVLPGEGTSFIPEAVSLLPCLRHDAAVLVDGSLSCFPFFPNGLTCQKNGLATPCQSLMMMEEIYDEKSRGHRCDIHSQIDLGWILASCFQVDSWARHMTSLSLSFLIYKIEIIPSHTNSCNVRLGLEM